LKETKAMKPVDRGGASVAWVSEAGALLREARRIAWTLAALAAVAAGLAAALATVASAPEPRVYDAR
jgi:hypothetical protein